MFVRILANIMTKLMEGNQSECESEQRQQEFELEFEYFQSLKGSDIIAMGERPTLNILSRRERSPWDK